MDRSYREVPSMAGSHAGFPGDTGSAEDDAPPLSALLPSVATLGQVVTVDAVIPGCPPPPETMAHVMEDLILGRTPADGAVFANRKALCHECPRLDTRPDKIEISRFKRLYEVLWDPDVCFLPQGLICLGPVTRGGCAARCIGANMPCRGCFGPTERVDDFGAGAIACIAAMLPGTEAAALEPLIDGMADPTGLFYRYSLAASVLGRGWPS
jgi:F420-non-reducing hydrogenase small subunit